MNPATPDKATQAVREAAADWSVRLDVRNVLPVDKAERTARLRCSTVHARAFLRAEAAWSAMTGAALHSAADVEVLLALGETNVVPLPPLPLPPSRAEGRMRGSRFLLAAAATIVLILGACFTPYIWDRLDPNTYVTDTGEQR